MANRNAPNYAKLKELFDRACNVLRGKFKTEWNIRYGNEWNDSSKQVLITVLGRKGVQQFSLTQRKSVANGTIDEWDISTLNKLLTNKKLFMLSSNEKSLIEILVNIAKKTAVYGIQDIPFKIFESYWSQVSDILISFGDSEEQLKQLRGHKQTGDDTDDAINGENTELAKCYKEKGNKKFTDGKYSDAIEYYTKGIILDDIPAINRAQLYSYRCHCYLKLDELKNALDDANSTIEYWPEWWRGYFRKAQVYTALGDRVLLGDASKCLSMAQQHITANDEINGLKQQIQGKMHAIHAKTKSLINKQ